MFKIGYYQFRPIFGNIKKNTTTIVNALSNVKADLIRSAGISVYRILFSKS